MYVSIYHYKNMMNIKGDVQYLGQEKTWIAYIHKGFPCLLLLHFRCGCALSLECYEPSDNVCV